MIALFYYTGYSKQVATLNIPQKIFFLEKRKKQTAKGTSIQRFYNKHFILPVIFSIRMKLTHNKLKPFYVILSSQLYNFLNFVLVKTIPNALLRQFAD